MIARALFLFVWGFHPSREFFTHFHHNQWRAANPVLMAIEHWRFLNVAHMWHPFIIIVSVSICVFRICLCDRVWFSMMSLCVVSALVKNVLTFGALLLFCGLDRTIMIFYDDLYTHISCRAFSNGDATRNVEVRIRTPNFSAR